MDVLELAVRVKSPEHAERVEISTIFGSMRVREYSRFYRRAVKPGKYESNFSIETLKLVWRECILSWRIIGGNVEMQISDT